jgi:hypothetical protein
VSKGGNLCLELEILRHPNDYEVLSSGKELGESKSAGFFFGGNESAFCLTDIRQSTNISLSDFNVDQRSLIMPISEVQDLKK